MLSVSALGESGAATKAGATAAPTWLTGRIGLPRTRTSPSTTSCPSSSLASRGRCVINSK